MIEQSQAGDTEAYRFIIREFGLSVRSFVSSRIHDYHAVEDITQDIFIAAYQSIHKYQADYSFQSWLLGISRNKVNDYLKQFYSQKSFKTAYELEINRNLNRDDSGLREVTRDKIEQLQACLKKVPDQAKELLTARYFNHESVTSLAQRLNLSENAVSSKLFRLKKKLKVCMESL